MLFHLVLQDIKTKVFYQYKNKFQEIIKDKKLAQNLTKSSFLYTIRYDLFYDGKMRQKSIKIQEKLPVHKHIYRHIYKIKEKNLYKLLHAWTTTNHTIIHIGELLIIGAIGFGSLINASYTNSYSNLHRNSSQEISQSLNNAIQQQKPSLNDGNIISMREMDGDVYNTFAPGYCTYGAARISAEFFPYSEDKMTQARTRGGNATDRCKNAADTGFKIGMTPRMGALIVYSKIGSSSRFGHVGKVMYYNSNYKTLIVRDMNRISKFTMTDRWDKSTNENIKCYIYPGKDIINTPDPTPGENISQTNSGSLITGNTNPGNTNPGNNQIPIPVIPDIPGNTNGQIINTPNTQTNTGSTQTGNQIPNIPTQPDTTTSTAPPSDGHNSAPVEIPSGLEVESTVVEKPSVPSTLSNKQEIKIESNNNFSDITNHFLSLYEVKIIVIKNEIVSVGENSILEINIINKETKEPYFGILPFNLSTFSNNGILQTNINTVQLISKGKNTILFTAKETGYSNIIITIDNEKVSVIPISVK